MGAKFAAQLLANALVILPVFTQIVVGFLLKGSAFIPGAFWPQAERITYFVLLPALIANAIATGGLAVLEAGPLLLALGVGLVATAAARVVPYFELHARESSTCVQQADQPTEIRSALGTPSAVIRLSTWLFTRASTC